MKPKSFISLQLRMTTTPWDNYLEKLRNETKSYFRCLKRKCFSPLQCRIIATPCDRYHDKSRDETKKKKKKKNSQRIFNFTCLELKGFITSQWHIISTTWERLYLDRLCDKTKKSPTIFNLTCLKPKDFITLQRRMTATPCNNYPDKLSDETKFIKKIFNLRVWNQKISKHYNGVLQGRHATTTLTNYVTKQKFTKNF